MLAADEPDADVATLAAQSARIHHFAGNAETAMERIEFALEIAEEQVLPEVLSQALNTKALLLHRAAARGRALLREALEIALEHDLVFAALRAYNNLMVVCYQMDRREELDRSWSTHSSSPSAGVAARFGFDQPGFSSAARAGGLARRDRAAERVGTGRADVPVGPPPYCSGWRGHTSSGTIPRMQRMLALAAPDMDTDTADVQMLGQRLLAAVPPRAAEGRWAR